MRKADLVIKNFESKKLGIALPEVYVSLSSLRINIYPHTNYVEVSYTAGIHAKEFWADPLENLSGSFTVEHTDMDKIVTTAIENLKLKIDYLWKSTQSKN